MYVGKYLFQDGLLNGRKGSSEWKETLRLMETQCNPPPCTSPTHTVCGEGFEFCPLTVRCCDLRGRIFEQAIVRVEHLLR